MKAFVMIDMSEEASPNADARIDDATTKDAVSKTISEKQDDFGVTQPSSMKGKTTSVDLMDGGDDHQKASAELSSDGRNWRRIMANRRSARESRERRKKRLDFLEKTFQELSQEHALVLRENRALRQQISSLLPHVNMASYRHQQHNDLSMMAAAGGMASAPSPQFAPMGGIGGLGAGMGFPPALPPSLRLSGMPQLPSNYLNQQSLAMSQPNLGSSSYYEQEQLGSLQALQKRHGMQV
jgi:bZIP transcription factor